LGTKRGHSLGRPAEPPVSLVDRDGPGNIRELRDAVEAFGVLGSAPSVRLYDRDAVERALHGPRRGACRHGASKGQAQEGPGRFRRNDTKAAVAGNDSRNASQSLRPLAFFIVVLPSKSTRTPRPARPRVEPFHRRTVRVMAVVGVASLLAACSVYGSDLLGQRGSAVLRSGPSTPASGGGGAGGSVGTSSGNVIPTAPSSGSSGSSEGGTGAESARGGAGGEGGSVGGTEQGGSGSEAGASGEPETGGTTADAGMSIAGMASAGGRSGGGGQSAGGGEGGAVTRGGGGGTEATVDPLLIDDLEDGDALINAVDGRSGFWFTFNDGGGTQTPAATATFTPLAACDRDPPASTVCARSTANDEFVYAGVGITFDPPYDAGNYRGIRFWAKNDVEGSVTFSVVTASSAAASGTPGYEAALTLTSTWQQLDVLFSALVFSTWYTGDDIPLDTSELVKIQLWTGSGVAHDIFIDDVTFIE